MGSPRWLHQAGAVSFVLCAVAFVVGLMTLYVAEGPSAPDLWVYLASPSGRSDLSLSTFALTGAIVLLFVGIAVMSMTLTAASGPAGRLARYLAAIATAAFIGFLSLQYALVAVLGEGVDPMSQQFKVLELLRELDDYEPQPAWAKRSGDHGQDGPQQLHVGPNGTWGGTVTPEFNRGRINEQLPIRYPCARIPPAAERPPRDLSPSWRG